jgi:pimeloyl-ACP methyl ester carboxylesterase
MGRVRRSPVLLVLLAFCASFSLACYCARRGYVEHEVVIINHAANVHLSGTLAIPNGTGPFPAIVLLSGGGPVGRENSYFESGMFTEISDRLARSGVAVLRYDKRGVGKSEGVFSETTLLEFADDAIAAVEFLKSRDEIDEATIGLLGHSEGGLSGSIAVSRRQDMSFLILMASPGRLFERISEDALRCSCAEQNLDHNATEERIGKLRKLNELSKSGAVDEKSRDLARTLVSEVYNTSDPQGSADARISRQIRFLLTFDPVEPMRRVHCPTLALAGEYDPVVRPEIELPIVEKALTENGNTDVTVEELPGLGHMFQKQMASGVSGRGGSNAPIDSGVLDLIENWIIARVRK